jgi:hypothetical protein
MRTKGSTMPLLFSTADCALRILDAATIFMAFVILPMFLMALMRCFTAHCKVTMKVATTTPECVSQVIACSKTSCDSAYRSSSVLQQEIGLECKDSHKHKQHQH